MKPDSNFKVARSFFKANKLTLNKDGIVNTKSRYSELYIYVKGWIKAVFLTESHEVYSDDKARGKCNGLHSFDLENTTSKVY